MRVRVNLRADQADATRQEPLSGLLHSVAEMVAADLDVCDAPAPPANTGSRTLRANAEPVGEILCDSPDAAGKSAVEMLARVLEHSLEREAAVADLSRALLDVYAELNLLYRLLPSLATMKDEREIGEMLVGETARALASGRAALVAPNEDQPGFRIVAELGGALSGNALTVEQIEWELSATAGSSAHPAEVAPGIVRRALLHAPLVAQSTTLGVLFVTRRENGVDYTTHDQKLLEALAATGASALLNCRMHENMRRLMIGTIEALAAAVDAKDAGTHDHSRRVADLVLATARQMNLPDAISLEELELAGLLHDVGKIGVPDSILCKPGRLTDSEFETVKRHVTIGADILQNVSDLKRMRDCVLHHHERFDGRGYPDGLAGKDIPLGARLIAIADAYDVIVSDRPYHKGRSRAEAIAELRRCAGTHFDPEVVDAFVQVIEHQSALSASPAN